MSGLILVQRNQIDTTRWDACVEKQVNGLIYCRASFLDAVCENWDAIIYGDYEALLPLPWKKKWGIRYVYVPPFTLQMGIVGDACVATAQDWAECINQRFKYADVLLNFGNTDLTRQAVQRQNYILDLSQSFSQIKRGFHKNLLRNIQAAKSSGLASSKQEMIISSVDFFQNHYSHRMGIDESSFAALKKLCMQWYTEEKVFTRSITDSRGEMLATTLFFKDEKRIYNAMPTTTAEGRKLNANHLLLTSVLEEFAGTEILFDFEGSDLPGVARFYQGFGAQSQPYFHWRIDNLHPIIRHIKNKLATKNI